MPNDIVQVESALADEHAEIAIISAKFHAQDAQNTPILERLTQDEMWLVYLMSAEIEAAGSISDALNKAFAEELEITNPVAYQPNEVWIPVESRIEAEKIRPLLIQRGFNKFSVFQGVFNTESTLMIKGENKILPYFSDPDKYSKSFHENIVKIGLNPQYVFSMKGIDIISVECELTPENVSAAVVLLDSCKEKTLSSKPFLFVENGYFDTFEIRFAESLEKASSSRHTPIDVAELRHRCIEHSEFKKIAQSEKSLIKSAGEPLSPC
jgi:hypothetical protein